MSKLHIFDMDGTLLAGSACLELSRHLGQLDAVHGFEERWSRGELGHVEFYEILLPLWSGLGDDDIEEVFGRVAWVRGIQEVWADIAGRGEFSAVISLSPQFFAERLLRWGVHTVHGAKVEAGRPPDPAGVLTPESKVAVAAELMETYGLSERDCVAYGDSSSDLPLFERLPNTVAVNSAASLREIAAVAYDGDDLRGAYAAGRGLLSRAGAGSGHLAGGSGSR